MFDRLLSSMPKQRGKVMLERLDNVLLATGRILSTDIQAVKCRDTDLQPSWKHKMLERPQLRPSHCSKASPSISCHMLPYRTNRLFSAIMTCMSRQPLCCPGLTPDWTAGWCGAGREVRRSQGG